MKQPSHSEHVLLVYTIASHPDQNPDLPESITLCSGAVFST